VHLTYRYSTECRECFMLHATNHDHPGIHVAASGDIETMSSRTRIAIQAVNLYLVNVLTRTKDKILQKLKGSKKRVQRREV
jgi:hypothetical protein